MKSIEVAELVRNAVERADESYYEMSGGVGVNDNGVETYISACISQDLYKNKDKIGNDIWISLEEKFGMMLDWSNADRRGGFAKPHTKSSRVDVAVYDDEFISFVIEVKRGLRYKWIKKDISRVDYLLDRLNGSDKKQKLFKFGIIAGIASAFKDKKSPSDRLSDVVTKIEKNHPKLNASLVYNSVSESDRFPTRYGTEVIGTMPYCILLERK